MERRISRATSNSFDIVTKYDVCIESLAQLLTSYLLHLDNIYGSFDEAATQLVGYLAEEKKTQEENGRKKREAKEARLEEEKEYKKKKGNIILWIFIKLNIRKKCGKVFFNLCLL